MTQQDPGEEPDDDSMELLKIGKGSAQAKTNLVTQGQTRANTLVTGKEPDEDLRKLLKRIMH